MQLSSTAFRNNGLIPTKYAHQGVSGGANISVPLAWSDVPAGTKSFALSIIDPHPVAGNWVHWCVVDIPPGTRSIAEGASLVRMPGGARELYTSYGATGYGGPEPPRGSGPHPYVVTLYALSAPRLECTLNATREGFLAMLEGKILASARTTGVYER